MILFYPAEVFLYMFCRWWKRALPLPTNTLSDITLRWLLTGFLHYLFLNTYSNYILIAGNKLLIIPCRIN